MEKQKVITTVVMCVIGLTLILSIAKVNANNANNNNKLSQNFISHKKNINRKDGDNWNHSELTDTFKIENNDQGLQKVNLKCGSNSMHVVLETDRPFTGVMYTKGSFYDQQSPCFVKPSLTDSNARLLEMTFQFDQCQTIQNGDLYTNVVVIQNDPDLITPGDAAFSLECDFRTPRSLEVGANMQTRDRISFSSKITRIGTDLTVDTEYLFQPDIIVYSESDIELDNDNDTVIIEAKHNSITNRNQTYGEAKIKTKKHVHVHHHHQQSVILQHTNDELKPTYKEMT